MSLVVRYGTPNAPYKLLALTKAKVAVQIPPDTRLFQKVGYLNFASVSDIPLFLIGSNLTVRKILNFL